MFVTQDDFNLIPYNIVGIPEDGTFDDYVAEQEENYLRPLLGNIFYDALVAGVESLPDAYDSENPYATDDEVYSGIKIWKSLVDDNEQPLEEGAYWTEVVDATRTRWLKLIAGANYDYSSRTYKWWGMKKMVKPLIYSRWQSDNISGESSNGRTKPANENSTDADTFQTICKAWNAYQEFACGKYNFQPLFVRSFNWAYLNFCISYENSLYGYLYVNSDDFDDIDFGMYDSLASYLPANFINPGRMNVFGL